MERFYLEKANIERKEDAIDYINEFFVYNSDIHGTANLEEYLDNYEDWLSYMERLANIQTCPSNMCPGYEYFLIRENDNKLVGMINLRYNLSEWMLKYGGHIGYSVRPTERRKGYNKISLYLCLLEARKLGIDKVLLTASDNNLGSVSTILSLDGILEDKVLDYEDETVLMMFVLLCVSKQEYPDKKVVSLNHKQAYIKAIEDLITTSQEDN